ncbi:MAG: nucleotidyltransferase domain-containing protein, partial [bacterium]
MISIEKKCLETFKALLLKRVSLYKICLFGGRARGETDLYSDADVLVVLDKPLLNNQDMEYVSDCAWKAGFEYGIIIVPIVFTKQEWK